MSQHLLRFPRVLSLRIVSCVAFEMRHCFAGLIFFAERIGKAIQRRIVGRIILKHILIAQIPATIIAIFHVQISSVQVVVDSSIRILIARVGVQLRMCS